MAYTINFNGVNYTLPSQSERNWATQVNTYFQALAAHTLQKTGGSFTLTAEADFGSSYGMALAYIKSKTANPATFGYLRLSKDDKVIYRNNANTADVITGLSSADRLQSSIVISFSADDTTDVFTATGKVPVNNDRIQILTFTGVGLTISGTYYVTAVSGATFKLWTSPGGPAFADVTTAGTGTMLIPDEILTSGSTDTLINKTISGASNTLTVRAANDITGILPIANGGTGSATGFSDLSTTVSGKLDRSGGTMTGGLVLANDPVGALEAATKQYVDGVASGLNTKQSVRAASTGPVTLSTQQTIDGVSLIAGDRVLVKNQASAVENGLYIVAVGSWTRATDMDIWSEVPGAFVFVTGGTQNGTTGWVCTSSAGGTIGVDNINWTQFSGAGAYTADGQGLELSGTQFSLELDGTTLSKSSPGLKVAPGGITNTEINNSAGIARSKIAGGTASHVVINDGSGNLSSEAILATSRGGTGINALGAGVATFLGTPSSANLRSALTDETGTGAAVFADTPTIVSPVIDNGLTMNHETTPSNPAPTTVRVYPKSDNRLYLLNSAGVETPIGSGSGQGEKTYITNPSGVNDAAAAVPTGWANVGDLDIVVTKTDSELPREYTTDSGLKITADSNTQSTADYVYFDFTLDDVDLNRKLKIQWSQKTTGSYTAGNLAVVITTQADRTTALHTPVTTAIPASTGDFVTTFDAGSTATLSLVIRATTDMSTDAGIVISDVVVGPGQVVQGAAISEWQTFTPTLSTGALGSVAYNQARWRRVGSNMEIEWRMLQSTGTAGSGSYLITIPGSVTADTSFIQVNSIPTGHVGEANVRDNTSFYLANVFLESSTRFGVDIQTSATARSTWGSGSAPLSGTNVGVDLRAIIPIAEWAGSGTVNLGAGSQVEFAASTNGIWNDNAVAANTIYGPAGAPITGSLAATRTKVVRFQYPIQQDDVIDLEFASAAGGPWVTAGAFVDTSGFNVMTPQVSVSGAVAVGCEYRRVVGSTTDIEVVFCTKSWTRFDGSANRDWQNGWFWRLRKAKASSPVGFGQVNSNEFGLMPPQTAQTNLTFIASSPAATPTRAVGIAYRDQAGNWRLRFNMRYTVASGSRVISEVAISGVTFKNIALYSQALSATANGGTIAYVAYAAPGGGTIFVEHSTATTSIYVVSGDVELESRPTWA
jgi:hypothetical protein